MESRAHARRPRSDGQELERLLREAPKGIILVIDDDEGIRAASAEILELAGYRVVVAADGQEAVDLLAIGPTPQAIVLDLMMPRMDGWTFLTVLRADPRFHDVPVMVTSAAPGRELPSGADLSLPKPFDAAQLGRAVARLCAH